MIIIITSWVFQLGNSKQHYYFPTYVDQEVFWRGVSLCCMWVLSKSLHNVYEWYFTFCKNLFQLLLEPDTYSFKLNGEALTRFALLCLKWEFLFIYFFLFVWFQMKQGAFYIHFLMEYQLRMTSFHFSHFVIRDILITVW